MFRIRTSLFVLCAVAASGLAIVPNNGPDTDFAFVGRIGGASGVAIGARSVITAKHVGGMTFDVAGSSFTAVARLNHPSFDLSILNFDQDLPGFHSLAGSSPIGSTVTMVGFGGTGEVNGGNNGYTITGGGGTRRKGNAILDFKEFVPDFGPSMLSFLRANPDAVVVAGDSGGGFFIGNQLVGVSSFYFSMNTNLPNYGFASQNGGVPYFGSGAIDLTDAGVRDWVNSAVPEPASMLALGAGLAALAARRRRSAA